MKLLCCALFLLACGQLKAQEELTTFESLKRWVEIERSNQWTYIHLKTAAGMKGPRIIRNQVRGPIPYTNDERVIFDYYFIEDVPHSLRSVESITVTWKVLDSDWEKWKDKQIYFRKLQDVPLLKEDIDMIKSSW